MKLAAVITSRRFRASGVLVAILVRCTLCVASASAAFAQTQSVGPALPSPRAGSGNVNFFVGGKGLQPDYWSPVDVQDEFGAVMTFGQAVWPIQIAVDALTSADDEAQYGGTVGYRHANGTTAEIDFGVRKIWRSQNIMPYLGGGLGYMNGTLTIDDGQSGQKVKDAALGIWVDTGVFFRLGRRFNIGMDLRWSKAPLQIEMMGLTPQTPELELGGVHFGLLLGWGW